MADPILTGAAVRDILLASLAGDEPTGPTVDVEGIIATYRFSVEAITTATPQIEQLIGELEDAFVQGRGGGWTFLNLCNDRHGQQWADLHTTMEALCVLAIAARRGQWCLPREYWHVMPGGMPYVVFWLGEPATAEGR
ncbi:hypothetical protein SAMN02799622_00897 [Methylobacterium sp. UNC378MF]|uniref:hypothetical protein n=1 Tax=Methylobacterium sp. UNC378MF TaxID=1502748 RepID=UPI000889FBEB|nr:hypothetical protein [Methylobacterium sp. UNC378MF]SDA13059.1 hypothetical protein SAMN02799622_00897 [Methylobacterium sp. UNC378MF]